MSTSLGFSPAIFIASGPAIEWPVRVMSGVWSAAPKLVISE